MMGRFRPADGRWLRHRRPERRGPRERRLAQGERLRHLREVLQEIAPKRPILIDVKTDFLDLVEAIVAEVSRLLTRPSRFGSACAMRAINWRCEIARAPRSPCWRFCPTMSRQSEFYRAGAIRLSVWEGDLHLAVPLVLLETKNVWVTTGGRENRSSRWAMQAGRLRGFWNAAHPPYF